jgi:probable phosphoglycerate mutase
MRLENGSKILFLRHGETDYNRLGLRCGGEVDIPLSNAGYTQAEYAARHIERNGGALQWIVASSMLRVKQTTAIVAARLDMTFEIDARLNERRLGDWNGRKISETEAQLKSGVTPPGGESNAEFSARVLDWLTESRQRFAEPGLIVASKGIGRVLCELLIGRNIPLGNCDLLLFEGSPGGNRVAIVSAGRPWAR